MYCTAGRPLAASQIMAAVTDWVAEPYLKLYQVDGPTITPHALPSGYLNMPILSAACSFSGEVLITGLLASGSEQCIQVYARSGSGWVRQVGALIAPSNAAAGALSYSPNGVYFTTQAGNSLRVYKRLAGGGVFFNELANTGLPAVANDVTLWSPDSNHLAVNDGVNFKVFKRVGDTFTAIHDAGAESTYRASYSPDGQYMARILSGEMTTVHLLKRVGDSYLPVSSLAAGYPISTGVFTPNSSHMAVPGDLATGLKLFKRAGDSFNLVQTLAPPIGAGIALQFTADGRFLVCLGGNQGAIQVYRLDGDALVLVARI